ncbi:aromatic compound dioxygenase [Pholiota conissans]|uniref:Aromatic compound dioxygenase n=1 Tax=Pholiota conissans TaxID=109636 RepID=A0A9P5YT64_9AGAR|nr:aromatic compound dioxygenase [Pholiota conissans]
MIGLFYIALLCIHQSLGHRAPKTEHEIEVQRALQAAAYHCAPAVESFTASRKRSWAQRALTGIPGLPGQQGLFSADTYADIADSAHSQANDDDTLMNCTPISETHIQNNTCVLAPEVTEGPYYHNEGHPIRQNIAELQDGLLLLLDIGVIDVETCQPLPNVLVDVWQANATGYYAGHPLPHPHLANVGPATEGRRRGLMPAYPRTVHEETWLRGAWPTDKNGVVQFTTIYPGYYTGRATHIHTKVYPEWSVIPENNTFKAGRLAHTGQWFFDEDMNMVIDKMHPYITNPIKDIRGRTRNSQDSLNIFQDSHGPEGKYNPIFKVHLLGGVLSQGLVAYITMGVNASASYDNFWKG